jgi:DNA-directed RNA polymerase subunit F
MKVNEEKLITWHEARKILDSKAKEKALGYEQKNALEHLKKFCKISGKAAEEMVSKLAENRKLKEKHIISIINIMPKNTDELRILFANEAITLSEEEKKKIINIVKKFG